MTLPVNLGADRHGESEGNVANHATKAGDDRYFTDEFRSRHSFTWRLSDRGVAQAAATGEWARRHLPRFDRFYVSPMPRAMETAALLDLPAARWYVEVSLRERDWGQLDTMTLAERQQRFAEVLASRKKDPFLWTPPSGESIASVDGRLHRMLDTWHRECSAMNVVVVGHGEWMWALRFRLERMSLERWRELDASKDPHDEIHNCQVIWYTRQNPHTGELSPHLSWMRMICPWDPAASADTWEPIVRHAPSNAELLAVARSYPRMIT